MSDEPHVTGYNGWANWDTWAVMVNISNTEAGQEAMADWCNMAAGDKQKLKDIIIRRYRAYMHDRVDQALVDWDEIAEAIYDDYSEVAFYSGAH